MGMAASVMAFVPPQADDHRTADPSARLLSVAAAMLIYVLNSVFMTAVQVAGAAIALALA